MVRQDDILLNAMTDMPYTEYGCALMCEAYHAVMWPTSDEADKGLGYHFTRANFVSDCTTWQRSGALSKELDVSWDRIAHDMGFPYRIVRENGTHILPKSRTLKEGELQIVLLRNPETSYGHFVVMNKYDQIMYDPLGMSVTQQAFNRGVAYIESRRIFRRIK